MSGERRGWIHVSGDRCGFCGQRHSLELEYRCVGCDREVCALCLVVVRHGAEPWCPECEPEES